MFVTAQSTPSAESPPFLFTVAIYSLMIIIAALGANILVYLLRRRLERIHQTVQGISQNRYVVHIQGPGTAVLVAFVGGYGVNILTGESGSVGYLGVLMALPLPLFMVVWSGVRQIRQTEFEQAWPPEIVPVDDPVKIRHTLRRVRVEGARIGELTTEESERLGIVLTALQEVHLPALRHRRDRGLLRWLRDHPWSSAFRLGWGLLTVAAVALAVVESGPASPLRAAIVIAGLAVVTGLALYGLQRVRYRYSVYRYGLLAEEVAECVATVRRRITELRLGLAAPRVRDSRGGA